MSASFDTVLNAAERAHAEGRLDEAQRLAFQALEIQPSNLPATVLGGIVAVKRGDPGAAIPLLSRAVEAAPTSFEAPFWLSLILRKVGQLPQALSMARMAVKANPSSIDALNQLGMCQLDADEAEPACQTFLAAINLDPNIGPIYENLGRAFQAMGRVPDAIVAYRQALEIGPVRIPALYRLGDILMTVPDTVNAAQCAQEILRREPNSPQGNLLLARALIGEGHVAEGAKFALRASELSPGNAAPVAYYGRALQSLGEIEAADVQFRRSIELEPKQGFAYYALVHNHKVKEEELPLVEQMLELAKDSSLPVREQIQLQYGLGKALEDLGRYEEAMKSLDEANRIDHLLKVGVSPFDKAALAHTVDVLIEAFDKNSCGGKGSPSEVPIFVVGMMRSGTTLAEQILSSHPDVGGAGELLFWPDNAGYGEKILHPESKKLDIEKLNRLAQEYLDLLATVAPDKPRVVDKMNTNYLLLGPLLTAFPKAKVVHMKRNPMDTCLSIWATPVANGIDLCGSKENVVEAYRQYVRLMAHWRAILPADRFLDVQYEELVSDQERVTQEMIAFCGLPWSEACLKPQDNKRAVKTPSVWQVRQPVYKTSMARWKKFEPWLGPFAELGNLEV